MGVFYFLLLSCLGLATTTQAQDCGRPTGGPNMLPDTDISSSTFPDGSTATFVCQPGYVKKGGNGRITCTNGTWSPLTLKCEKFNCGAGEDVENGQIEYHDGTLFGDKMVITCNTGYRLVGRNEIYCGVQGWADRMPVCEAVKCEPPSQPVDGSYSPNKEIYNYGDAIFYTCLKDYTLNGTKTISCSENGKFKPSPPTCVKVSCKEPDVPNGYWVEGARPPYGYKASVTYKCKPDYKMKGEDFFTCEINSRWSPEPPTCIKSESKPDPTPDPDKNSGNIWRNLGIAAGAIAAFGCGVLGFFLYRGHTEKKKEQGIRIDDSDKDAENAEGMALS